MIDFKAVTYALHGSTGVLTLNRPEARNALDLDMRAEIAAVIALVREDAAVRALVITGAGGAFCAGGDLKSLSGVQRTPMETRERIRRLHQWFEPLVNLERPVIAAVDGAAFGAGLNLALAADFVLCSTRARFCAVFGRIGLVPDLGGFFLLPRIVGLQRAKEIVFTARVLKPAEAQTLGIVHSIHPPAALMPAALAMAARFAHASTAAIGMAKNILNQSFHLDQRALIEMESYAQALAISTDYHQQAVAGFLAKKPPVFDWEAFSDDQAGEGGQ